MNSHRVFFTPSEDAKIIRLRKRRPDAPWSEIAKQIKGKTAKQCNDRFNKHLRQAKNDAPWTDEEDERLKDLVRENGHNWVVVSQLMSTRTNIEAKNRWTVLERMKKNIDKPPAPRLRREQEREEEEEKPRQHEDDEKEEEEKQRPEEEEEPKIVIDEKIFANLETETADFFAKCELREFDSAFSFFDQIVEQNEEWEEYSIAQYQ